MGPADGPRVGCQTTRRARRVHPVDAAAVREGRGEVRRRAGPPGHVRAVENAGPAAAQGEVRLDRQAPHDDEVAGDGGRRHVVAAEAGERPAERAGLGVESLDPARGADDDLVAVGGEHRCAPGDARLAVGLPHRVAGEAVDGQQIRVGAAGQQDHDRPVGQEHGVADAVVAADRAVVGDEIPAPDGVAVVGQRQQIAAVEEGVEAFAVDGRRRRPLRHVVVPFQRFGRVEPPPPAFRAVVEVQGGDVRGLLHRPLDRREEDAVVPDDRARLAEPRRRRPPRHRLVGPGEGQARGAAHVRAASSAESGPAGGAGRLAA